MFTDQFLDKFQVYAEILDVVLNHFQFLVIIMTIAAFIYLACGVFPGGLSKILGPCGLTLRAKLRARFACKTSRSAQRVFLEFALLESGGAVLNAEQWNKLLDRFVIYMSSHKDMENAIHEIDNCVFMTKSEFSEAVERYFDYLSNKRVRSFYSISKQSDFWVTKIVVHEAYVMPAILLSGLLARYEENWDAFLAKYVSTASMGNSSTNQMLLGELYNMFAWLLWGPSREICWRDGWEGLCQISYGDESNSLPAFMSVDGDAIRRMQDILAQQLDNGIFGCLCSADVMLFPKREFFRTARGHLMLGNSYFHDKIAKDTELKFVALIKDFTKCNDYRAQRYYCTAYLWVLFELDRPGDWTFHPETSVAFFEHANLANAETCDFLTSTLLNKALAHFKSVFDRPEMRTRRYNFVCGFSGETEKRCRERFATEIAKGGEFGTWLSENVSFKAKHDANQAFSAIDDFFETGSTEYDFEDIAVSNAGALADLAVFYAGMYTSAFPVDDERESLTNIIEYVRLSRQVKEWKFHVILMKDAGGKVTAGAMFDYFARTNSVVIEFIVVDVKQRMRGQGTILFNEILKIAQNDAKEAGGETIKYAFCEVESPDICKDKNLVHLHFWSRNNFYRLDFNYVQPSLGIGQNAVHGLWFLCKPCVNTETEVPAKIVENVVWDYVHYAMNIADPVQNADFIAMQKQLNDREKVKLRPVIS